MGFEYKVVPAPTRGKKAKGAKNGADRFALALSEVMNTLAAEGWDYLRTDTLPSEERHGLTGRTTVFQNMLVFRREAAAEAERAGNPGIDLNNIFADNAPTPRAPKLPSAHAAQDVSGKPGLVLTPDAKRGVAAE